MAVTPLYRIVENHLRDRIESGALTAGDLIPSEPRLARQLNVSQGTVKKAVQNLVHLRLLRRHQGKGTYVSGIDFNNSLVRCFSSGRNAADAVIVRRKTPMRRIKHGSRRVCAKLGIRPGSELLYIERAGYIQDTPVLLDQSWLVARLVKGLGDEDLHFPDMLYAHLQQRLGIPIVRCTEMLTAESADSQFARRLAIAAKDPLLALTRTTYTTGGRAIEYRITRGRADCFSYHAEVR